MVIERLTTSRIVAHDNKVGIPGHREECEMCQQRRLGVCAPWGVTRVCGNTACQLAAQLKDKGTSKELVVIEHRPLALRDSDDWKKAEF